MIDTVLVWKFQRYGIAKARAQGKQHGRPKPRAETIKGIKRLRKQGKSLNELVK